MNRSRLLALTATAALAAGLLMSAPSPGRAGPFDCAVVYDEFESLMNKKFLLDPGAYVPVIEDRISRAEYDEKQKGRLLLNANHEGMGVAIVQTNENARGKFLFSWSGGPGDLRGAPLLILREVTLFGRVEDGSGQHTTREIRVSASQAADLDTGRIGDGAAADVRYRNVDGETLYLEAVNGATLTFPTATLCKQ